MDNNNQLNNGNQLDPNAALNNQTDNVNDTIYRQAYYNNVGTLNPVNIQANYNNIVQNSSVNNGDNTDNEEYLKLDKTARNLASDFLALGVFVVIIIILAVFSESFNYFYIVQLGIIVAGHSAAKALKPSAGVFGIIMGILLIISFNLIDLILGIFILIRSIKYISLIKKV